ncbi:MAG: hypothetical protein DRQ39_04315 [Gammaproteobacteria bacterium]|nr:MAG: hypothetical protein DRQ39_04315 [Gammaproteobacteria bacterium]
MRLTEQHFEDLASAAWLAKESGDDELAERLDVMARKANLECSRAEFAKIPSLGSHGPRLEWQDMPSVFDIPTGEPT